MRRSTPAASHAATSASLAHSPPTVTSKGRSSRPARSRSSRRTARRAGHRVGRVGHADPAVAEPAGPAQGRPRLAADEDRDGPLDRLGLEGHFGEGKVRSVVRDRLLGPQPAADADGLVEPGPPRGRVDAERLPLRLQPARARADHGASARDPVQGAEGPGGDEGMAQAEQVDVRAEAERRRAGGHEGEQRGGVEELRRRGHGRMLGVGKGGPRHGEGQHEVLGQPGRLEAQLVGRLGGLGPEARMHAPEGHGELHAGAPGTADKLPGRPVPHMARLTLR